MRPAPSGGLHARDPHVVLVLVDDQGYGDLSCHGHPELHTPHIDALAEQSVRFADFHTAPMCTPTRGSLLTGMDALRHQAVNVSSGRSLMRTDLPTLPERLAGAGYATGLFGKWHLGDNYPYTPVERGFSRARWFPSSHVSSAPDRWRNDYFDTWLRDEHGDVDQYPGYCTDALFDLGLRFIADAHRLGTPSFTYLSLNALHKPWLVPEEYRTPYRHLGRDLASYFGMVANLDENMGRLDRELQSLGIAEDTVVVYLSDNGADVDSGSFYNAGMRGYKTELWEGGHRVPLFVRWPAGGVGGDGRGREVHDLAVVQDLMPTLLELCELPAPAGLDGVSVAAPLRDAQASVPDRTCVIQYSTIDQPATSCGQAVVLWGKWRLVDDSQLFDVASDPGQECDVAASHPDVVQRLRAHYARWWADVGYDPGSFLTIPVGAEDQRTVVLSSADWQDTYLDQQEQIRRGVARSGAWTIEVARPGTYRIDLRRWPVEADLPIAGPAPEHEGGDCVFPAGLALPIVSAHLRIGSDQARALPVSEQDTMARFEVEMAVGATTLHGWFEAADGSVLCGSYYAYVDCLTGS